jgi:hypothetical protein
MRNLKSVVERTSYGAGVLAIYPARSDAMLAMPVQRSAIECRTNGANDPLPYHAHRRLAVCGVLPISASAKENRSASVKREFQLTHAFFRRPG